MSPDLERLIDSAKDVLQQIADHPEAESVESFIMSMIKAVDRVREEIEEDLMDKQERADGLPTLRPLTVYPILPTTIGVFHLKEIYP